jgi:hypothetical protein
MVIIMNSFYTDVIVKSTNYDSSQFVKSVQHEVCKGIVIVVGF